MDKAKSIENLRKFRRKFGGELNDTHINYIFGREVGRSVREGFKGDDIWRKKLSLAREYSRGLQFMGWVKFIAVTGSVAAEVAKEEDDIDIYVVVKNNRMWLYRGFMMLNPRLVKVFRRVGGTSEKDRICLNLISEERGVYFEPDIFNFHELYFMKPVFNPAYKEYILNNNKWVTKFGGVLKKGLENSKIGEGSNRLLGLIDYLAFLLQYLFMVITRHNPEYNRLVENNRKGRIEFFPVDYKKEVLTKL